MRHSCGARCGHSLRADRDITAETVATLDRLTQRIDTRLGRGAGQRSGADRHRGVADPTGHAQIAVAVPFQPAGGDVYANVGLDRLYPSRRRPAPLDPHATARSQTGARRTLAAAEFSRHQIAWPRSAFPNPPMTATLSEREEYF